jgi:Ca2+-binding RTX toxin-like protein
MPQPFQQQAFTFPILTPNVDFSYLPTVASTLIADGANTVQINPFLMVQDGTSSHIITAGDPDAITGAYFDPPSDAVIQQTMNAFKAAGLSIEMKVTIDTYDRSLPKDIAPTNVDQWFAEYKAALVDQAEVAQANGVTKLIITNELENMTTQYRAQWLDVISAVRSVYSGQIGVNALPNEAQHLTFGDKIDFVGLSVYPLLTTNTEPTVAQLVDGWMHDANGINWFDLVNQVHSLYNLPVEVSEVAFVSRYGAASQANNVDLTGPVDLAAQQNEYEAFFDVFSNLPSWFSGVSFWRADESPPGSLAADDDPEGGPSGTTIVGKPAEVTVHDWFNGLRSATGVTLTGTATNANLEGGWNNDTLISGPANDLINGGPGTDTAVFSGDRGDYRASLQTDGTVKILDMRVGSPNAMDTVSDVEIFKFSDKSYSQNDLLAGAPDLVAMFASASAQTVAAGTPIDLNYTIANAGASPADPSASKVYLSTDNVITASDRLVGGVADGLLGGGSSVADSTKIIIPWDLAPGTYYLGVVADADGVVAGDNRTNNVSTPLAITVSPNHAPVVALTSESLKASPLQSFKASNLITVTDADAPDPRVIILQDNTADAFGGHFVVNGVVQAANQFIILTPDQFAQTTFQAGMSGSDEIFALAYDGKDLSNVGRFIVAVGDTAPVVTPAANTVSASANQILSVSPMFSATDADSGDPMYVVLLDNNSAAASGHFLLNGVAQAAQQPIIVPKAYLGQVTFEAAMSGADDIFVAAYDGKVMSLFKSITINVVSEAANATLVGTPGNDIINGNGAAVTITGGLGADTLTAGSGNVTFAYNAILDSTPASHDLITDFQHGHDKIDFTNISGINASGGVPTFQGALKGSGNLTLNAHSVGYIEVNGVTEVLANTTAAPEIVTSTNVAAANMEIVLTGIQLGLTSTDFHHF